MSHNLIRYVLTLLLCVSWQKAYAYELSSQERAQLRQMTRTLVQRYGEELAGKLKTMGLAKFWLKQGVKLDEAQLLQDLGADRFARLKTLPALPVDGSLVMSKRMRALSAEDLAGYVKTVSIGFYAGTELDDSVKATITSVLRDYYEDTTTDVRVSFHVAALPESKETAAERLAAPPAPVAAPQVPEAPAPTKSVWDEIGRDGLLAMAAGAGLVVVAGLFLLFRIGSALRRQPLQMANALAESLSQARSNASVLPGSAGVTPRALSASTAAGSDDQDFDGCLAKIRTLLASEAGVAQALAKSLIAGQDHCKLMILMGALGGAFKDAILQQADSFSQRRFQEFLRTRGQTLLANQQLLLPDAKDLYRLAWLAIQDPASLNRYAVAGALAQLRPEQLADVFKQSNPAERGVLVEAVSRMHLALMVANNQIDLEELRGIDLDAKATAHVPSLVEKVRKVTAGPTRGDGLNGLFNDLAKLLPQADERRLHELLGRFAASPLEQVDPSELTTRLSSLSIDDTCQLLAAFDETFRARVIETLPELTARRVMAHGFELSERSLELKAHLVEWAEGRLATPEREALPNAG